MYGLTKRSIQRLSRMLGAYERGDQTPTRDYRGRPTTATRATVVGKLTTTLTRSGTATLEVFRAATTLVTTSSETLTVLDCGQLATGVTLGVGTTVTAAYCDGVWLLIAYDCDEG